MSTEQQSQFHGWAKVEVMGHQQHIGFVRTEAYGAAVLFRVDTPELPEREYILTEPQYTETETGATYWARAGARVRRLATPGCSALIGAGAIFRIMPCDEAAALKAIDVSARPVLKLISLPEGMLLPEPQNGEDDDDLDSSDDGVPY